MSWVTSTCSTFPRKGTGVGPGGRLPPRHRPRRSSSPPTPSTRAMLSTPLASILLTLIYRVVPPATSPINRPWRNR